MITEAIKIKIVAALAEARKQYDSDARHARSLEISTSVYNAVKKGNTDKQLSNANWVNIARKLGVKLKDEMEWKPARTATFEFITAQLELCQSGSLSAVLCDLPNIGKTFTARHYVATHRHAVYVDCSQVKTKQLLIRFIAKEFGLAHTGRYADVYGDLVFYLSGIDSPLIVLDEAGDLKYDAFLELKALWNATERSCAWYMMGADGLKEKINRSIACKKVGYTEMLSRYGDKYSRVTPEDGKEREHFMLAQAVAVAKVNAPQADAVALARKSGGALRRVYTEIEKMRRA